MVWSRISRFSNEFVETRQDQDFKNKDLEYGKETRHSLLGTTHQNARDEEN